MNQSFPSDWPSLPQSVSYKKDLSERFATESEPEYLLSGNNGVRFMIRELENGEKRIITYDLRDHSTQKISDSNKFFSVLEKLYTLLDCQFLHSPPVSTVQYRGYHPEKETIWECKSDDTFTTSFVEQSPSSFTATSFCTVDPDKDILQHRGRHLATATIPQDSMIGLCGSTAEESTGSTLNCKLYENAVLHTEDTSVDKKLEITNMYPVPDSTLVVNTIDGLIESNRCEVKYINTHINTDLLSMNI